MSRPEMPAVGLGIDSPWLANESWPPSRRVIADRVAHCLDLATRGRGQALVLAGGPGIGRTTLIDWAVAQAGSRFEVLQLAGHARDESAPGDTLDEMTRQAEAITSGERLALPLRADTAATQVADLAALVLGMLDRSHRPVLIAVDDAQWVDDLSLEVLGQVARRLGGRHVALLLAVRFGPGERGYPPAPLRGLSGVVLDRLTDDEVVDLLRRRGGCSARAWPGVDDVVRRVAGSPLAVQLFASGHPSGSLNGDGGDRARLGELFRTELEGLSRDALDVAEELAVRADDEEAPLPATGRDAVLAELEVAGVLCHRAGQWRLSHPLLAPALLAHLAPARLRTLHALAAESAATQPLAIVQSLRHRVCAANGCDDGLAATIERAVEDPEVNAVADGRLLVSAAMLTAGRSGRLRRLLRGIRRLLADGRLVEAGEQLGVAEGLVRSPGERAQLVDLRAEAEALSGSPMAARDTLLRLASDTALEDPDGAARRYARSASLSIAIGDVDLARSAVAVAGELGGADAIVAADAALVRALTGAGLPSRGDASVPWLPDPDVPAERARSSGDELIADPALLTAWAAALSGHTPEALTQIELAVDDARRRSAMGVLPARLIALSGLRLMSGRVVGGLSAAEESLELARAVGADAVVPRALLALARAEAVAGRDHDCQLHLGEAKAWARTAQDASLLVQASSVAGFLCLSQGDPAGALAHLEANPRIRLVEDAVLPWQGDLIEALVRMDSRAEARRLLAEWGEPQPGSPALRCAMGRALGLLADDPRDAAAHLIAAVEAARAAGLRIEEARGLTVLGEVLRDQGSADARRTTMAGAALFDALGATNWHTLALNSVREPAVRSAGGTSPQAAVLPGGADLSGLTAQELRVAELAADGLTNQQLASTLFLSVRTVEFHLSNAYRKLQVSRRAQLVRVIAAARRAD